MELPTQEEDVFMVARRGDTLMSPFQCDLCHFRNIKGRNPYAYNSRDSTALAMIRRANLDSFWSRTSATVYSNLLDFRQYIKHGKEVWGEIPCLPPRGPYPVEDRFGMSVATITLSRSLDAGRNAQHLQFNTARRIRSAYSNNWNASLHTLEVGVMQEGQNKLMTTDCPVYHYWYTRMMKGMHERMGDLIVQDQAISRELQLALMELIEDKLDAEPENRVRWIEVGTYVMILWLGALRGNEAMMSSLDGCRKLMRESESSQTPTRGFGVLVLQGRFKSSTGATKYLLYLSSQTQTDFRRTAREWLKLLIDVRESQDRITGWLFCDDEGKQVRMSHFEASILELIVEIQERDVGIVPRDMDVFDRYGVFRSWRRGATSIARNSGLSEKDIELNNWWRKVEDSRGKHVSADMISYYTEDLLVIDAKLRFSETL